MNIFYLLYILCIPKNINKKTNYSKHNIPLCKECIYYQPYISYFEKIDSLARCKKFGYKDIVSGEIMFDYAISSRKDENKCGSFGKKFEYKIGTNTIKPPL